LAKSPDFNNQPSPHYNAARQHQLMRKEVALLHEVNAGNLDNLECPNCQHKTVSAWFTHPEPETFRTYLICADCDFWSHVINSAMPPFFSEDRVRLDLQEKDAAILKSMRFKAPRISTEGL